MFSQTMAYIKNIKEVTELLKEQILKGDVYTIDEMKAWLKPLGYSDTIKEAAINFILREFEGHRDRYVDSIA